MFRADLHIHSTASDGLLSPAEIVSRAVDKGLSVISLTDHDTVDGIDPALEAAASFPNLILIPGVEISTDVPDGEVHILGYFVDHTDHTLIESLERMRNSRIERARRMVARLGELGCPLDWERVQEIAGDGVIGRPHIAQALLERGHTESFKVAFDKYISRDGAAYVEREKVTPSEAVTLIVQAKGLPVLAHPLTALEPEKRAKNLKEPGLVGIEAYYAGYSPENIEMLVSIAHRHDLITTGGTDFHGFNNDTEASNGRVDVPKESVERLLALARKP